MRAVPRGSAAGETRASCRAPRRQPLCVHCAAPAPGGKAYCEPCAKARSKRRNLEAKREADRRRYAERRARGDCTVMRQARQRGGRVPGLLRCRPRPLRRPPGRRGLRQVPTPTFGGTAYCAPCAVAKAERRDREAEYAARRARYADRRARGRCVECDTPSPGVARCGPCSRKHRESSGAFRGIPIWDPSWTVIEIATGREHGPYDSEADVALCLVFEKLARDEVEVLCDASPMSSYTAPPW